MGKTKKTEEEMELNKKISYNIRKARKKRKYTQEELAEKSRISYDFMRRIETTDGECGFSVFTLYKIAIALETGIDELTEMGINEDVKE